MVLKMDELPKFLPALCVFILFNSIIAQPFMDALNPHHHFYVYPSGGVTKYYNSSEWPSDYEEDLNNLQLLRGTRILTLNRSSCVLRTPEDKELYEAKTTRKNSSSGGIRFAEIAKKIGIHHVHRNAMASRPQCVLDFIIPRLNSSKTQRLQGEFCVPEHLTGGAAVGDYDNDGLVDIYFTVFDGRSVLYRNNGYGTFTDVTRDSNIGPRRYGNGANWADVDQDGDLDLYVTTVGDTRHYLYINYGGWFQEEAIKRNCSLQFPSLRKLSGMSANFGDFDNDGYPDLYVTEWIPHTLGKPSASRLLRNKGGSLPGLAGYFEDVTERYRIDMDTMKLEHDDLASGTFSFASSFTDFDNDGLADLLVTADFGESRLYWNMGQDRPFEERTEDSGLVGKQDAMGHAVGDWNNDGLMDWFSSAIMDNSTSFQTSWQFDDSGNKLYQNKGGRQFDDVTEKAGVVDGGWGWGAAFLDFNNDGHQDIVMTNGIDFPATTTDDQFNNERMRLWQNLGAGFNGRTKEVSQELGLNSTNQGRGLLKWDFDDDGDVDVVVCNNVGAPEIYENLGGNEVNFWLKVNVMHRCKQNTLFLCESLGARVQVVRDGFNQTQEIGSNTHFLAQSERTAYFGLGPRASKVTVHVTWPSSKSQRYIYDVPVNTKLQVIEPVKRDIIERIEYSSLETCPFLKITEITRQPSQGRVEINANGRSVRYVKNAELPPEDLEHQEFSYKVEILPNHSHTISRVYNASIYFVQEPECENGKSTEYKRLEATDERRYDGISNNKKHLMWGAVHENLRRRTPAAYSDGITTPASVCDAKQRNNKTCAYPLEYSGYGSTRPSPREISNMLFQQTESITSERKINAFHVHFGQFINHDTDLTIALPRIEFQQNLNDIWLPISVPKGDVHFDLGEPDSSYLPFVRSVYNRCTGRETGIPREQINVISSYIDGSMVYGSNVKRNKLLRTLSNGKMKVWNYEMLPLNEFGVANGNDVGRVTKRLFLAGDTRANIQPGLTAIHTVFVREHNRICEEYLKDHPKATDEDVFQYARKIVIAELQAITFNEYLPSVLGGSEDIPPYRGYSDSVDATTDHILTTAAFRFGHSQINSLLWRVDENGTAIPEGHLPLRDAYFSPERIIYEGGIDPIIRGALAQTAEHVDTKMVDEVRNFLFAFNRRGQDLTSINIQRGRDHGLPDMNTVRESIGLPKYKSFEEITSDKEVVSKLKKLYHNINNVDLWVGGLAEDHIKGELGPTFRKILLDSFLRIRDGDRFWYQSILSKQEIEMVESSTLSEIIRRNTNITNVPRHVFYSTLQCRSITNERCVPYDNSPEPVCDHDVPSTGVKTNGDNSTETELRNRTSILENKLLLREKEKQNLTQQLTMLQRKYNECTTTSFVRSPQDSPSKRNSLLDDKAQVSLIVLFCVLLTSTIIFCVLYLKEKKENRLLVQLKCNHGVQNPMHSTKF